MSVDYESTLHKCIVGFIKRADKDYPNWSRKNL